MSVVYHSRKSNFYRFLYRNLGLAKPKIGEQVVDNIDKETPVDTGDLLQATEWFLKGGDLYVQNTIDYAPYVELGTYKKRANPFMKRGINNSMSQIANILIKELGV